jgi:hypothetical protein
MVVTTIVMGLGQATFIPSCTEAIVPFRLRTAGVAILLMLCVGWLFTGTLHRHLLALFKRAPAPARETPPNPPVTSPKP